MNELMVGQLPHGLSVQLLYGMPNGMFADMVECRIGLMARLPDDNLTGCTINRIPGRIDFRVRRVGYPPGSSRAG
jgi:hypothetical protein